MVPTKPYPFSYLPSVPKLLRRLLVFDFRDETITFAGTRNEFSPDVHVANHCGTKITFKSTVRTTGPKNNSKTISVMLSLRLGNEKSAQSFVHKVFPNPGRPDPNPRTSRPLPKTTQKRATCIFFCPGYPDVWAPDVPGISCPKTLSLGCFFCLLILDR